MSDRRDGRIFKALSLLLAYPQAEIRGALPDIRAAVMAEGALPAAVREGLRALIDEWAATPQLDLEERYVTLFDRTRGLSLDLFEHIHGEARDRGQAMVDLKALYRCHGFDLAVPELPDHLPLFLEFLSTRPRAEARALLGRVGHILARLAARLGERESRYAAALEALVALADERTAAEVTAAPAAADTLDDPNDLAALDRAWAEEAVTFGPAACPAAGRCPAAGVPRPPAPHRKA
ncbi:MAG: nitrate reductase molybdenum cofactor assembly chaperone [Rhodothalassiaceae bacterium]